MASSSLPSTTDSLLGFGASGSVYKYYDTLTNSLVAVKRIDLGPGHNLHVTKEVEDVHKEVSLMKEFNHVRIVQYIRAEREANILSIYMELMSGGSVKEELDRNGPLSEIQAKRYTLQLLEGLSYLHGKYIIHRDIKGSNILCDGKGNIKLADFGVSKQIIRIQTLTNNTNTSMKGTAYWMAPEVIQGTKYGRRADIWSVGATLVEMLTTDPPWYHLDLVPAMFKIANLQKGGYVLDSTISNNAKRFLAKTFTPVEQRPGTDELLQHSWLIDDRVEDYDDEPEVPDLPPNVNTNSDVDSDLSDGEDYFVPKNDDKNFIKMEVRPTTKPRIKQLFSNIDQVYRMSTPVRGRALVINNDNFIRRERYGSDVDTKNIVDMLEKFKLTVDDFFDLTAKEMLAKIRSETQNKDHRDYQLFVLVIMTHGNANDILYGIDEEIVRLIDVLDLLSSQNFPGMAGKPKVLIIEAGGGSRKDFGDKVMQMTPASTSVGLPPVQLSDPAKKLGCLNVDDLIVFKSCCESYKSMRHPEFGTLFIRCLVTTLYKHACHRDVCELFKKVRDRVRKLTIALVENYHPDSSIVVQVPICYDTLTHGRKLYLFPGYEGKSSTKKL